MGDRTCVRDLASKLDISKTTCHRMIKNGVMRPHSNAMKPGLTDKHKHTRVKWILDMLMGDSYNIKQDYHPMYDFVHLDEKWFFLSKKTQKYYLGSKEKGQHRSGQSSVKIPKVMFT